MKKLLCLVLTGLISSTIIFNNPKITMANELDLFETLDDYQNYSDQVQLINYDNYKEYNNIQDEIKIYYDDYEGISENDSVTFERLLYNNHFKGRAYLKHFEIGNLNSENYRIKYIMTNEGSTAYFTFEDNGKQVMAEILSGTTVTLYINAPGNGKLANIISVDNMENYNLNFEIQALLMKYNPSK